MLIELSIAWTIALNVIAWVAIQMGLAWGLTRINAARFNPDNSFARAWRWERNGRFYERFIFVKAWKDMLPDAASWFHGGFAKANLRDASPEFVRRFLRETWRGELVHWLAMLSLPLFCIWNPWWAMLINAAYAVAANVPCIIVQRYNRARLRRLLVKVSSNVCEN